MLNEDVKELSELRVELATTVAGLKSERDKLEQSRILIEEQEKVNLMQISATYDKMDATAAGKILTNMSQNRSSSSEDAVKILYYMSERNKAKVLAAIAEAEPAISAYYCSELKQIAERE
jgi:flagellar motility protein MotE (MotC chaperone)